MSTVSNLPKVRPADFSPETLAVCWIERVTTPPRYLAEVVRQYRDLTYFAGDQQVDDVMNVLFDRLVHAAADRGRVTPEKQARHLSRLPQIKARRQEHRLERQIMLGGTLQQKWDLAILRWRNGVRV